MEILGDNPLSICRGATVDLQAITSTGSPEGLSWTSSDPNFSATDTDVISISPSEETVYFTTFTLGECVVQDSVLVQVDSIMMIDIIENQSVCDNETPTFILNNTSGQPGVVYQWTSTGDFSTTEPDPEVMPTETTTYFFSATIGGCVVEDTVTISFIPPTTLTVGPEQVVEEDTDGNLEPANLTATLSPEQPQDSLIWTFLSPDGLPIGTGSSVDWVPTPVDSLPNFAFISVNTGCAILIDSILIRRQGYRIPNIFSPNNDGVNDVFRPFFLGEVDVLEVRVYNRWGNLVFESSDTSNPGWNGVYNDKDAPSDVYLWEIRVGINGDIKQETGQVTLVR